MPREKKPCGTTLECMLPALLCKVGKTGSFDKFQEIKKLYTWSGGWISVGRLLEYHTLIPIYPINPEAGDLGLALGSLRLRLAWTTKDPAWATNYPDSMGNTHTHTHTAYPLPLPPPRRAPTPPTPQSQNKPRRMEGKKTKEVQKTQNLQKDHFYLWFWRQGFTSSRLTSNLLCSEDCFESLVSVFQVLGWQTCTISPCWRWI